MYVCICNKVTDRDIQKAAAEGAQTVDCLKESLKVATCCGRCHDCASRVLHAAQQEVMLSELQVAIA